MKALDRKLLRDLTHMRGQVATIALVVACGIAVFVAMRSVHGSLEYTQTAYYDRYRFADVFASLERAPLEVADRVEAVPGVGLAEPRVVADVPLDLADLAEPARARLVSLPDHGPPLLNDLFLRSGRLPERGRPTEALVSEAFALAHSLKSGDRITAILNGRRDELMIVGVALGPEYIYSLPPGGIMPDDKRFAVFWVRREALAAAFDMVGAFNDLAVRLAPGASRPEVIARIDRLLEPYGGLGAYGRDEQISSRFVSEELKQLKQSSRLIPGIFLGVAAFLLNVVLSRMVGTQREQIAALKALGYSDRTLALHYIKLVMVIVLAGAVLGSGLGAWLGRGMTRLYVEFFHFPILTYRFAPGVALLAILVSAVAAIIGAVSAAYQVARLQPAEAMRPLAPPAFKPTVLERLGFQGLLSQAGRMILRNIESRPARTLMSSLAVAFSVAMLIVGRFSRDSIDFGLDVQFSRAERQDLTVTFRQPVMGRGCRELEHLPGVNFCEAMRAVPVELRIGHRKRRMAILGFPRGGGLRRVLDVDLKDIELPGEGVVLSSYLGRELGVRVGDLVTVKALEGHRLERRVPVAGLVDEFLGVSAYMDLDALNRLMRDQEVISGALLSIDPSSFEAVFAELKQIPAVAGVDRRDAAVRIFKETTGRTMLMTTVILVLFAGAMAAGVVYNAARIALSERSRELASLRVLGFTRAEISVLLLTELGVQLLLALPLGCLLGYGLARAVAAGLQNELYRIPVVIDLRTYVFAMLVVSAAGVVSALLVRHRLDHLDLVAVLKSRE